MIHSIFCGLFVIFLLGLLILLIAWDVLALCFNCDFDNIRATRKREYCTAPMKFNHWRDMYYLNPEKWNIGGALPSIWGSYKEDNGRIHGMSNIYINFKGIDAVRYSLFAYNIAKNKEKERKKSVERTATIAVLQTMEDEIEKIKKQSQEEIEQSAKQTKEIKNKFFGARYDDLEEYCNW